MNKDKELKLHGTPKALYDRVRAGLEGETQRAGLPLHVGGGGVLEARWDHRESLDIDVVIPTDIANRGGAHRALQHGGEEGAEEMARSCSSHCSASSADLGAGARDSSARRRAVRRWTMLRRSISRLGVSMAVHFNEQSEP